MVGSTDPGTCCLFFFFHYRSSYFSVKFTLKPFGCRRNDIYFDCYFDHVLQMVLISIFLFVCCES